MTNKDIRMQEPLYNSAFLVLFIGAFSGLTYSYKYLDVEVQNNILFGLEEMNLIPFGISAICLMLSIILCVIYIQKIKKHNLENPTKKMKAFTMCTFNELNDDDELFSKSKCHSKYK